MEEGVVVEEEEELLLVEEEQAERDGANSVYQVPLLVHYIQ